MPNDPLAAGTLPDRVFYGAGILLDAEDFRAEQTYHRGRLARALSYLFDSGAVAGLKVDVNAAADDPDETLIVRPGLAIDRIGRLIETPQARCIRLARWYADQAANHGDDLTQAFKSDAQLLLSETARDGLAAFSGFVADLFVSFHDCERGRTPAFANGPFDAIDASLPSRIRDSGEFELRLRTEPLTPDEPKLPRNDWPDLSGLPDLAARRKALQDKLLTNWREGSDARDEHGEINPAVEHLVVQDHTSVLIARIVIPASTGSPPTRVDAPIVVDNWARRFIYPAPAAARLIGI